MDENQVSSTVEVTNTAPEDVTPRHFSSETAEAGTESETVENVEEVAASETADENDTSEENSESNTEEKKSKSGFEKRIERMNRKIAERDRVIDELMRKVNGETTQQPQMPADRPRFEQFNDIEAFTEALTDWKLNNKLREVEQKNSQKSVAETYKQREADFAKSQSDYYEVIQELQEDYDLSKLPEIIQVAFESDVGPKLAYHLAKNTDELERIAALPSHRRLIELGKLEDRLSNTGVKETKPVPKVSKAPAPITAVKGSAPVIKSLEDPNLSQAEYRELRMAKRKRY